MLERLAGLALTAAHEAPFGEMLTGLQEAWPDDRSLRRVVGDAREDSDSPVLLTLEVHLKISPKKMERKKR